MLHPARLGKYPITGVIGEGAMGVVYKGVDPVIGRPVAIKTIRARLPDVDATGAHLPARFRNEAQAVGRLSHPAIVGIYEYGEDNGTAFIAMEYVEGRTLSALLAATPVLGEATVVRVMAQLLDALQCAHKAGVWHRDIKPANVMVTAQGGVKVADFGIARVDDEALTVVTAVVGTPGYIAPEQYLGQPIDHRIDIFAAGVLLYRLLTGDSPFAGRPDAVMFKTVHATPPAPSVVTGGRSPAGYDAIVAKALAKNRDDRYASAADFRRALLDASDVDATMISRALSLPTLPAAPPVAPVPTGGGSNGSLLAATRIGNWEASALAPFEQALARAVGPLAKVLVRRAAQRCPDAASLVAAVAAHIENADERSAFLAETGVRPATRR
jgi:serine/threonine-protein kinase